MTVGSIDYAIYMESGPFAPIALYFTNILKHAALIYFIEARNSEKPYIVSGERRPANFKTPFILSIFDTATHLLLVNDLVAADSLIYFIPQTLIFELIFDFFHYWTHRAVHSHPILYSAIHRTHHSDVRIDCYSELNHSPLDYIVTNAVPMIMAQTIYPLSAHFLFIEFWYKSIVEIGGHIGKDLKTPSFPQCIYLPQIMGIELRPADHNKHHVVPTCNFSKRFSAWDRIFGTFVKGSAL